MFPIATKFLAVLLSGGAMFMAFPTVAQMQESWRTLLTNTMVVDFVPDESSGVVLTYPIAGETDSDNYITSAAVTRVDARGLRTWTSVLPEMNIANRRRGILTSDGVGNTYIVGHSNIYSPAHHLHKISPNGQPLWRVDENLGNSSPAYLAADGNGNVAMASVISTAQGSSLWIAKYGADGIAQWKTNFTVMADSSSEVVTLETDDDGNWLLLGWSYSFPRSRVDALLKISPSGSLLWSFNSAVGEGEGIGGFQSGPDGSVYLSLGSGFRKLNPDGEQIWSITNQMTVLHVDLSGEVLVREWSGSKPHTVARLRQDGRILWRLPLKQSPFTSALDSTGNYLLATVTLDGWPAAIQLTAIAPGGEQLWTLDDLPYEHDFSSQTGFSKAADGSFRIVAQSKDHPSGTSVVAALQSSTVTGWPRFAMHPTNQVGVGYQTVHFKVEVESEWPAQLQWYHGASPLAGETNSSLTLTALNYASAGDYYAEVRNARGAVFSKIGRLRVVFPPYVSSLPQFLSLAGNASVDLPVYLSAPGSYAYQWRHNGSVLSHETNAVLRLQNVQADSAGEYIVTVSNEAGAATNLAAVVRVAPTVTELWRSRLSISNCCDQACEQVIGPDGSVFLADGVEVLKYSPEGALNWATNDHAFGLVSDGTGGVIYGSHVNLTRLDAQGQVLWQTNGNALPLVTWGNWIVTAGESVWLQDLKGMSVGGLTPECDNCQWQAIRILQPDSSSSLVCAGLIAVDGFNYDLGLAKLSPDGQTQWFVRPGIPLSYSPLHQFAVRVASDGHVTVAAVVGGGAWPSAVYQLITLRLDAEGLELWRNVCDGPPTVLTLGSSHLALDASGNAVAAGPGCIVKYDAHGHELWRTASGHPLFGVHDPKALAVDKAGAIYVAGNGSYEWQQMVVEKLSPDGNSLWASALDSRFAISSLADVDLAEDGSLYVSFADNQTSSTFRFAESDVPGFGALRILTNPEPSFVALPCGAGFTTSASATGEGTLQYQWFFNAPFTFETIALAGATNQTLALSNLCSPNSGQYFLEARNQSGVAASRPVALDVGYLPLFTVTDHDSSVLGEFARVNTGGSVRLRVLTYGNELPTRWQWFFNGSPLAGATNTILEVTAAGPAQAGSYSLAGTNKYGSSTHSIRLLVEDRVRTIFETRETVGGMEEYEDPSPFLPRLAVNSASEVYLLGTEISEASEASQWFVSKYSADGTQLWRVQQPGLAGSNSKGAAILLDSSQNILVAANELGGDGEDGVRVIKLGPEGDVLWTASHLNSATTQREASALVSNPQGDVFLAGIRTDWESPPLYSFISNSFFIIKLQSNGQSDWEGQVPADSGFGYWNDLPALACAADGSLCLAGNLGLTKFSPSGARLWERAGPFHGLSLDPSNRVYAARIWAGLTCFDAEGTTLWTTEQAGRIPLADATGVFTADLYRVFRHSSAGELQWTSHPIGGTGLALAPGGGCYVARSLASKLYTRKLHPNGSETWLATSVEEPELKGHGSAVAVCANGDIVSAHLLIRDRTPTEPTTAFYLLQRLRESPILSIPELRIDPAHVRVRPGERVCFAAQFNGGPAEFQWFQGSYPLLGETNLTFCFDAQPFGGQDFWVHAVTTNGGFASAQAQVDFLLPFVQPPVPLTNGMWRLPIWSKGYYLPLVLESSTNLLQWEEMSFWQNAYPYFFYYEFPQTAQPQRYFRVRHVAPQTEL